MTWSLSEFLNLVELRSQSWCFVNLGPSSGFRVPENDAIFFYAALEGTAKIADMAGGIIELHPGDIVMILSGEAHALRNQSNSQAEILGFLHSGASADTPVTFNIGDEQAVTRLLCGRLKVRWPGGQLPDAIPAALQMQSHDAILNFPSFVETARGSGASALLTRLATLLFIHMFRGHPQCQPIFRHANSHDPIARAQQCIQRHPFFKWTVGTLARKVGMGRSNFATRFVAEVGRTPIDVLTEERMKHAAEFLKQTDLKVAQIGERIGYRSEAAFSRRFVAHFGMTPGQMRKQKQPLRYAAPQMGEDLAAR